MFDGYKCTCCVKTNCFWKVLCKTNVPVKQIIRLVVENKQKGQKRR